MCVLSVVVGWCIKRCYSILHEKYLQSKEVIAEFINYSCTVSWFNQNILKLREEINKLIRKDYLKSEEYIWKVGVIEEHVLKKIKFSKKNFKEKHIGKQRRCTYLMYISIILKLVR